MIIVIFLVTSNWSSCSLDSHSIVTPWTIAHQAPLSMGFPRQEYCGGLPFPSPENLPEPGIKPMSPAWQALSLPQSQWKALNHNTN